MEQEHTDLTATELTTKELYRTLVEVAQAKEARGEKTRTYKEFIEKLAEDTGDDKILFQAAFSLIRKAFPSMKINRSHVRNVVDHNWETTTDPVNKDLIWINVNKPKTPRITDGTASTTD